jgi:phosphomannomutase
LDIVKFTAAYATFIRKNTPVKTNKIVVGRDARISGEMVKNVVCGTLMGMGFDVVNIGLASTPTTEGLNPLDIVKFTSAYATLIRKTTSVKSNKIVVGRDARISGLR